MRGEFFYGAKMLSDATLSSWIGGSQCSDKVIIDSKRFLFIISSDTEWAEKEN